MSDPRAVWACLRSVRRKCGRLDTEANGQLLQHGSTRCDTLTCHTPKRFLRLDSARRNTIALKTPWYVGILGAEALIRSILDRRCDRGELTRRTAMTGSIVTLYQRRTTESQQMLKESDKSAKATTSSLAQCKSNGEGLSG